MTKIFVVVFVFIPDSLNAVSRRAKGFVGKKNSRAIQKIFTTESKLNLYPCHFQLARTRATTLCVGINHILEYTRSIVAKQCMLNFMTMKTENKFINVLS